jgi:hypothetical protein
MASDIDWDLQERGLAVIDAAASTFGQERFASGQIHQAPGPTIHLYGLTVTSVRYGYVELVALYDQLAGSDLPGDACISYGFDAQANALRFTLTRLDMDVVAYILERVPAEAVRITVEPRAGRAFAL